MRTVAVGTISPAGLAAVGDTTVETHVALRTVPLPAKLARRGQGFVFARHFARRQGLGRVRRVLADQKNQKREENGRRRSLDDNGS